MAQLDDWLRKELEELPRAAALAPFYAADLVSELHHLQRLVGALFSEELAVQESAARELAGRLPGFLARHPGSAAAWHHDIGAALSWADHTQHRHIAVPARQLRRAIDCALAGAPELG